MRTKYSEYYSNVSEFFDQIRLDRDSEIAATVTIIERYADRRGARVLDVGCGTGRYATALNRKRYKVFGIDVSLDQLRHAPASLHRLCASCTALPFANSTFPYALAILLIQQLTPESQTAFLRDLARVMCADGIFVLKTCSHDDLRRRPLGKYFPSALPLNLQRYPDLSQLTQQLVASGFEVADVIPTYTEEVLNPADLLRSIELKHNTTLALLPKNEFESGLESLRDALRNCKTFTLPHYHTILVSRYRSTFDEQSAVPIA